ncbi:MAG: putative kinase [Myxococcota bacterium]
MSTLIILGGLPGSGKTTLARLLAARLGALHLRIDTIEQAIRGSWLSPADVGDSGYRVGYALAGDSLRLGLSVIADSVNPLPVTRADWRETGMRAGAEVVQIEVVCSDPALHRARIEARHSDIPGLVMPTWADVLARDYRPWTADLTVDTTQPIEACMARILSHLTPQGV